MDCAGLAAVDKMKRPRDYSWTLLCVCPDFFRSLSGALAQNGLVFAYVGSKRLEKALMANLTVWFDNLGPGEHILGHLTVHTML